MRKTFPILTLALLLVVGAAAQPADACPNCKDSVAMGSSENTGAGGPTAGLPSGFNTSIYVMLSAFVGVLGFVGYTLYRGVRDSSPRPGFQVADKPAPAAK